MRFKKILLLSLLWIPFSFSYECVYPVAFLPDGDFFLLYQKSIDHVELWRWNPSTHAAELALLTRFTPAGLQLIPKNMGFSFIDNGIIRVKMHHKRSPKTLILDKPLYDIKSVLWHPDLYAIVSASLRNSKGIFSVSLDGSVKSLLFSRGNDFVYPSFCDNTLFYIEKSHNNEQYFVKQYDSCEDIILHQDFRPLAFLQMDSRDHGIVLSHPSFIRKNDYLICFKVYELERREGVWSAAEIFSFSIPTEFIFFEGNSRLYESMLPLLPRVINNKVYFYDSKCDFGDNSLLSLYVFHKDSGVIPLLQSKHHFFGIGFDGKSIVTGGIVTHSRIGMNNRKDHNTIICIGDGGPPMNVSLPSVQV